MLGGDKKVYLIVRRYVFSLGLDNAEIDWLVKEIQDWLNQ